jgi:hypothetical protein
MRSRPKKALLSIGVRDQDRGFAFRLEGSAKPRIRAVGFDLPQHQNSASIIFKKVKTVINQPE